MRLFRLPLLSALALALTQPVAAQPTPAEDGRYLIQFKQFRGASAAVRAAGGNPVLELAPQRAVAAYLHGPALDALRRNPNVALIEADVRRYPLAQTTPYGIGMVQADLVSDTNAGNTTVCIIDSGYFKGHQDLADTTNVTVEPMSLLIHLRMMLVPMTMTPLYHTSMVFSTFSNRPSSSISCVPGSKSGLAK